MLSNNAGGGIMQFFDRDFPAEMASVGMEGLQEFMVFPDNLDDILARLEHARSASTVVIEGGGSARVRSPPPPPSTHSQAGFRFSQMAR